MIKKDAWVQIRSEILSPSQRAEGIPEETASTPLLMWTKGRLLEDCEPGDRARIRTRAGREEEGILEMENPCYELGYGALIPELLFIGERARDILSGGDHHA